MLRSRPLPPDELDEAVELGCEEVADELEGGHGLESVRALLVMLGGGLGGHASPARRLEARGQAAEDRRSESG